MYQLQLAIGNMPVNLILLSNGHVAFVRTAQFKALFEQCEGEGVSASFYEGDFTIGSETYQYNTGYPWKEIADMYTWLLAQKLQEPVLF